MKIPRFTADASLNITNRSYLRVATDRFLTGDGEIVPQQTHDYCFFTGQYYVCCHCTPDDGCACRSPKQIQF
jgi:hypothetical protein